MIALMKRRVYDLAGSLPPGIKIILNGKQLDVSGFTDYVGLFKLPSQFPVVVCSAAGVPEQVGLLYTLYVNVTEPAVKLTAEVS